MKTKRNFAAVMLLILAMLALNGCGSKNQMTDARRQSEKERMTAGEEEGKTEEKDEDEELTMSITFINNTGIDIYYLYASPAETDEWEEDILDIDILEYGEAVQVDFTYPGSQTVWDFKVEDGEGNYLEFYGIDFNDYGSDGAAITLNVDGTADIAYGADNYELPEVAADSKDIYEPVLRQYYELLKGGASAEEFQAGTDSDLALSYGMDLDLDSVGYAFYDIDGNGIDELFIGFVYGGAMRIEGDITYGIFTNLYSINYENKIELQLNSNRELYCYLCTDGLIGRYTRSIPFSESYEFSEMEGTNGLYEASGVIIHDFEEGWKMVTEGQVEILTYGQANEIINSHVPVQINFTPFSQLY